MNKYGKVALLAVSKKCVSHDPVTAWQQSAEYIFRDKTASIEKGCPKGAFLGIAEEGLITGIAPGKYTRSKSNKTYAIKALTLLRSDKKLENDKDVLWCLSCDSKTKTPNGQMDVVLALWEAGHINLNNLDKI